jgi:hypothetical protein
MAQANRELLAALRERLGITRQALSDRRARMTRKVSMPAEIATYVIAHREGINLGKYLDAETVAQVMDFEDRLSRKEGADQAEPRVRGARGAEKPRAQKVVRLESPKVPGGALPAKQIQEAERMASEVYPLLYVFENSVRSFVAGHLKDAYGGDWWEEDALVPSGVKSTVERNKANEGRARYHTQRTAHPIYFTNLGDMTKIVRGGKGWKVFAGLFPRDTFFPELVAVIEDSRNIVAHMNPLPKRDIDRIRGRFDDWMRQIEGHLPPSA